MISGPLDNRLLGTMKLEMKFRLIVSFLIATSIFIVHSTDTSVARIVFNEQICRGATKLKPCCACTSTPRITRTICQRDLAGVEHGKID